jgi:mercuric ion transport protein
VKIQLLTFSGCPNAGPARHALREAITLEHVSAAIEEIDVTAEDAPPWAKSWGSPTILIDGVDVSGASPSPSEASCRLYEGGAPSITQIRTRLSAARGVANNRTRSSLPLIGGVVTAIAASACCVVPAVLALVGVSGAGVASALAPYRPFFLALTIVALGAGFYLAFRPSRAVDA